MAKLLFIACFAFIIWLWFDGSRTKELAREAGSRACQNANVQFLDDTVVRKKLFFRRNYYGKFQICRVYQFEFCSDGATRYQGKITMYGKKVSDVTMDAYRIPRQDDI